MDLIIEFTVSCAVFAGYFSQTSFLSFYAAVNRGYDIGRAHRLPSSRLNKLLMTGCDHCYRDIIRSNSGWVVLVSTMYR